MVPPRETRVDIIVPLTHSQRLNILALGPNMKGSTMDRQNNLHQSKQPKEVDTQPPVLQYPNKDREYMIATSHRSINNSPSRVMCSQVQDLMASNHNKEDIQSTRNHNVNIPLELLIKMLSHEMLTHARLAVFQ